MHFDLTGSESPPVLRDIQLPTSNAQRGIDAKNPGAWSLCQSRRYPGAVASEIAKPTVPKTWYRPLVSFDCSRRTAEQRDELAPPHSITSSARNSGEVGTTRPSALAVLRLMISSIFVTCCTGRSAGFSPLRIRIGPVRATLLSRW